MRATMLRRLPEGRVRAAFPAASALLRAGEALVPRGRRLPMLRVAALRLISWVTALRPVPRATALWPVPWLALLRLVPRVALLRLMP